MKLPLSWLNEYVSTEGYTPQELADKLLNVGFEVEEIIYTGKDISGVYAGKIIDIQKHEAADKLQVCMVDAGKEITTIVTGAQNIKQGDIVPVALDGAVLPGNVVIHSAPLRGVMSYGMMCSGSELGIDDSVILGAEVYGILILPPDTQIGADIKDVLRLNEIILDISVTANRPDCQSIYGMAREVAAALDRKCKPLNLKYKSVPATQTAAPSVTILDEACPRYTCRVIEDVKIERSPDWMRDRLRYVGIRSINNVVDITNYVLMEIGQPLHAFDTSFVNDLGIIVRKATAGEKIVALDERTYTLNENMLVIADKNKPLAIAGVMGGEYSGINDNTTSVLLEAAKFLKGNIRSTSRALGLRSDSSARYEKGVDYFCLETGRERALALFSQLKAGTVTDSFAECGETPSRLKVIKTSAEKISGILGIDVKANVISKILKSLGFNVEAAGEELTVEVPLYREDIEGFADLAEEVIRFYGYDNIQATFMPTAKCTPGGTDTRLKNINTVKSILTSNGAYETCTYSFIPKKAVDKLNIPQNSPLRNQIEILNPLSEEYSVMRTQSVHNMLNVVSLNLNRKNKDFRLFEIGKIYLPKEKDSNGKMVLPYENDTLCIAFVGKNESFYTLKAVVDDIFRKFGIINLSADYSEASYFHPGISCDYYIGDNDKVASFGKLHPVLAKNYDLPEDIFVAEVYLNKFIFASVPGIKFSPLPKYQPVERDIAVTVPDDVPVGEIIRSALSSDNHIIKAELFDIYKGEQIQQGYKSVALSLLLSDSEKTLTDAEINTVMNNLLLKLQLDCNATLR